MAHTTKTALMAGLMASFGLVAMAQAQTTGQTTTTTPASPTTPPATTTMPPATTATPGTTTPGTTAMPNATMGTPPTGMTNGTTMGAPGTANRPAHGTTHTNAPRTNSAAPAAVNTSGAASRTSAAPVAGANSFTEGEARRRIQAKGYGNVTDLKKDDKGVWRGTAMKDGKSTPVALDYQGNVVAQ